MIVLILIVSSFRALYSADDFQTSKTRLYRNAGSLYDAGLVSPAGKMLCSAFKSDEFTFTGQYRISDITVSQLDSANENLALALYCSNADGSPKSKLAEFAGTKLSSPRWRFSGELDISSNATLFACLRRLGGSGITFQYLGYGEGVWGEDATNFPDTAAAAKLYSERALIIEVEGFLGATPPLAVLYDSSETDGESSVFIVQKRPKSACSKFSTKVASSTGAFYISSIVPKNTTGRIDTAVYTIGSDQEPELRIKSSSIYAGKDYFVCVANDWAFTSTELLTVPSAGNTLVYWNFRLFESLEWLALTTEAGIELRVTISGYPDYLAPPDPTPEPEPGNDSEGDNNLLSDDESNSSVAVVSLCLTLVGGIVAAVL